MHTNLSLHSTHTHTHTHKQVTVDGEETPLIASESPRAPKGSEVIKKRLKEIEENGDLWNKD